TDDVHLVDVKFNQVPALLGDKVDAVAGVFQNIEGVLFSMRGLHPVVFPYDRYGVPAYDELVVVANTDRLRDDTGYRATVRRFVAGLRAGTDWAKAHPAGAIAVMRRHSADDYRNVLSQSVPATLRLLGTERPPEAAWARFGDWMHRSGLLDEQPDAAALIARP
ncbi:MAG TPA: ABC transporter substrate-binding protein, partial [Gaiellales bacterium]|nr:ABC transporter substrate-binding protein [Gaiellales bacterium]